MNFALITGGCSFAETRINSKTWPAQLEKKLTLLNPGLVHYSEGLGSQGNGMISREIIFRVTETLKMNPSKVLVGIMWSHPSRIECFRPAAVPERTPVFTSENKNGHHLNPYCFVGDNNNIGAWDVANSHWDSELAHVYYKHLESHVGSLISTLEHILRVQWFLKLHKINYFMSTYTNDVLHNHTRLLVSNPNLNYLYEQIDFDNFLPTQGHYEWAVELDRADNTNRFPLAGNHPMEYHSIKFTEDVIMPFITNRGYI